MNLLVLIPIFRLYHSMNNSYYSTWHACEIKCWYLIEDMKYLRNLNPTVKSFLLTLYSCLACVFQMFP